MVYIADNCDIFAAHSDTRDGASYDGARVCVTVREFAIGMGPKLISHKSKKNGIVYSLRAFPIGGFVTMAGEDEDSEDENALNKKPVWKRMVITAAGAVMNIILGIILMLVVVTSSPRICGTTVLRYSRKTARSATKAGL